MAFHYEKTLWSWFNKKSMLNVQIAKLRGEESQPWILVRGRKGLLGYKWFRFDCLGDAIAALYEHELDSLIEKYDIPAMELIAMAADSGEAA
jgi:hypothetical protein